ncbi:hypothetical protein Barb7_01582 [Bacteroidales bacterium Barb7]|nr:hypothetical protein Barb7_01582 [Bacteroidales bacterium Barb7]
MTRSLFMAENISKRQKVPYPALFSPVHASRAPQAVRFAGYLTIERF